MNRSSLNCCSLTVSTAELCSLKNLSRNKGFVVVHPDKGNGVVILIKNDYTDKIGLLQSDPCLHSRLDADVLDISINAKVNLLLFLGTIY